MSTAPLVLITGGNGFVGYAVLVGALKAGVRLLNGYYACFHSILRAFEGSSLL